jgi:[ribosomal protein S18]-alanine N-acetyltransferase
MSPPWRRATLEDLPRLLQLDARCFARPWTEADWRAEFEHPGLIALAGDPSPARRCGDPALGFVSAPILGDRCELRRIGVIPSARGRGLGRDLLAGVIAHARVAGCVCVELEVAADNLAALALYRAAGFTVVGRRPRYYRDPPADALLLDLDLDPHN